MTDDLAVARQLAENGIPVFVSYSETPIPAWEKQKADPAYVDAWEEGRRLCAVMGQGVDCIDIDPRNGGTVEAIEDYIPEDILLGIASTPSGGYHYYIRSLGLAKKGGFLPGVDYQGGKPDGTGRGFVYLPPTIRSSKVDNRLKSYRWLRRLDLSRLHGPAEAASLRALIGMSKTSVSLASNTSLLVEGSRNSTLASWAGSMRKRGFSQSAIEAALLSENQDRCSPPLLDTEVLTIARSISRYEQGSPEHIVNLETSRLKLVKLSDVVEKNMDWLDEPIIAYGKMTMITGDPGLGKSELALKIAADADIPTLFISEDAAADVIRPRFRKLGGDLEKITVLEGSGAEDEHGERLVDLQLDVPLMEEFMHQHERGLLVLDPLNNFLPGVDTGVSNKVRAALVPLSKAVERTNWACLLLRHTNKRPDQASIYRGEGSLGGFTGTVRSELLVDWHPDKVMHKGERVIQHIKSNIGRLDIDRSFTIRQDLSDPTGAPLFEWLD